MLASYGLASNGLTGTGFVAAGREPVRLRDVIRRSSILLTSLALGLCAPGCGGAQADCGPVVHDALDPASGTHVLPGAPTPSYAALPPTSGAHQPGPTIKGPVHEPISPPLQVGVLEEGRVLIQYHGISDTEVKRLEALNSPTVVVAPAAILSDGHKVVATAWVTRQSCSRVDIEAMQHFAEQHAGHGPAH